MFKKFLKGMGKVAQAAVPIVITAVQPEALVNNAVLGGVKHGTNINNQSLPVLNLLGSTAYAYVKTAMATGDLTGSIVPAVKVGVSMTTASWGIHKGTQMAIGNRISIRGKSI